MKTIDKTHFLFEIECWERFLKYIELENVCLKNHLAALIKKSKIEALETLENFMNTFLAKDNLIHILRNEVGILFDEIKNGKVFNNEKIKHHLHFRKDILFFKIEFEKMKGDFINYSTNVR